MHYPKCLKDKTLKLFIVVSKPKNYLVPVVIIRIGKGLEGKTVSDEGQPRRACTWIRLQAQTANGIYDEIRSKTCLKVLFTLYCRWHPL